MIVALLVLAGRMTSASPPDAAPPPRAGDGDARWMTVLACSRGAGPGQVMWLAEGGGVLDGPFQGPMAAAIDRRGNVWVGDTLNGRILAFDPAGRQRRAIDLAALGKAAGLPVGPLLVDLVPGASGTLLIGDAANNAVVICDLDGRLARAIRPESGRQPDWAQINRVHGDAAGRIFVEDLARMATVVLDARGRYLATLPRQVDLAISPRGGVFTLGPSTDSRRRPIEMLVGPGRPPRSFGMLTVPDPINWASPLGVDDAGRLVVSADAGGTRYDVAFDARGQEVGRSIGPGSDPGYDPARPDWLAPDGSICALRIRAGRFEVLRRR